MLGLAAAGLLTGCVHYKPRPIEPAAIADRLEARTLDAPDLRAFLETNAHGAPLAWPQVKWDFEQLTLFHPRNVLHRARNSRGDVEIWGNFCPSLSHLLFMWTPARTCHNT